MAVFNEVLAGRFNRLFQKLFSMKGGPPAPQLGGEIVPSLPLFFGAEGRYLESWTLVGAGISVPAVAANQGGFRLRNPANSGVVAVLQKLMVGYTAADTTGGIVIGQATTDLANVVAPNVWDPRQGTSTKASLIMSWQNSAVAVPAITNPSTITGSTAAGVLMFDFIVDSIQEIPILPGNAIQLTSGPVNQAILATHWWRERALEDSEKA